MAGMDNKDIQILVQVPEMLLSPAPLKIQAPVQILVLQSRIQAGQTQSLVSRIQNPAEYGIQGNTCYFAEHTPVSQACADIDNPNRTPPLYLSTVKDMRQMPMGYGPLPLMRKQSSFSS